ncbi:hypothetical protein M3J09_011064 [Ascochyta lentis]
MVGFGDGEVSGSPCVDEGCCIYFLHVLAEYSRRRLSVCWRGRVAGSFHGESLLTTEPSAGITSAWQASYLPCRYCRLRVANECRHEMEWCAG